MQNANNINRNSLNSPGRFTRFTPKELTKPEPFCEPIAESCFYPPQPRPISILEIVRIQNERNKEQFASLYRRTLWLSWSVAANMVVNIAGLVVIYWILSR